MKENAPSGNPGTEVVGELPKLVVLGDLGELEEKEAANRIKDGINMLRKSFAAGESEVTVIDDRSGHSSLLAKQAEENNWTMKGYFDMFGGEADRVVVVGGGNLEAVSRARISLGVLLCCNNDKGRGLYNNLVAGYCAAIEQGLIEVALPPWHPQVEPNCILSSVLTIDFEMIAALRLDGHALQSTSVNQPSNCWSEGEGKGWRRYKGVQQLVRQRRR